MARTYHDLRLPNPAKHLHHHLSRSTRFGDNPDADRADSKDKRFRPPSVSSRASSCQPTPIIGKACLTSTGPPWPVTPAGTAEMTSSLLETLQALEEATRGSGKQVEIAGSKEVAADTPVNYIQATDMQPRAYGSGWHLARHFRPMPKASRNVRQLHALWSDFPPRPAGLLYIFRRR
ncbi:hypothetical protein LTR53_000780 [Teratosphaeriaceae sp. CCFEE 6253]|nr:hypothetical protein LTR53_000780 [Teratosphaeriaceae sp. CCFEE 6253]